MKSFTSTSHGSRRGSALLLTMLFAFLLAGVGVYMHTNSMQAAQVATARDNRDATLAAAEFASELAVANLSNLELRPLDPAAPPGSPNEYIVVRDWVASDPYKIAGSDQRRIAGTLTADGENMEYRVLVRSQREADFLRTIHDSDAVPNSWLQGIPIEDFTFNSDTLRSFSDTYEITATARNIDHKKSSLAGASTLKTLVSLKYHNPLNDAEEGPVFTAGDLNSLAPALTGNAAVQGGVSSPGLRISGEDHYGIKTVIENVTTTLEIEEIDTMKGTDSQLFSVINHSWNTGEQTLQYQRDPDGKVYNPYIPRTVDYSANAKDKGMIPLDPANPVRDKYVFGGKRDTSRYYAEPTATGSNITYGYGRSVTFLDTDVNQDTITENNKNDAVKGLYAQTAFVIGKFENFMKLYLNYTQDPSLKTSTNKQYAYPVTHPANDSGLADWRDDWQQLPLVYWTKNKVKSAQYANQIPLDNSSSTEKRHMTTKFWIKNKAGQFLGRDYAYTTSATPPTDWDGYYTWLDYYGYYDDETSGSGRYHMTRVPYRGSATKNLHTRFLTLEELTGFIVTLGPDGLPARLDAGGNVIGGSPAFVLDADGEMIPYRITVNGKDTQFNEAAQRANSTDNYGIKTSNVDDARYPPRDGIYVVERDSSGNRIKNPDGTLKTTVYRTMDDFSYELNIADAGDPEDLRRMVTIQMVVEQTPEIHPSNKNMYWDMGLCLSVVYPKYISGESNVNLLEGADKQWWEGPQEETMTERESHYTLTGRVYDEVKELTTLEDKLALFYQMAGLDAYTGGELNAIYSLGDEHGDRSTFKVAELDTDKASGLSVGRVLNAATPDIYYVKRDDLYLILSVLVEADPAYQILVQDCKDAGKDPVEVAMDHIESLPANAGFDFRLIGTRYDSGSEYTKVGLSSTLPSTLLVPDKYFGSRQFADEIFGSLSQTITGKYMLREDKGALTVATNEDAGLSGDPYLAAPVFTERLSFLPGERLVQPGDTAYNNVSGDYVPIINTNHNTVQYNGHPLVPKIVPEATYQTDIRKAPSWVDAAFLNNLLAAYGQREAGSRGGLGWHRNGPKSDDPLMRDHYEYVMLARPGFFPFVLAPSGEVAFIREYSSGMSPADIREIKFQPMLKNPKDMPTFVLEGDPLDGAGILVVDGNLRISTEFAYHGVLVVLGDLTVVPKKTMTPKRNDEGLIVNAAGQVLMNDASGYYFMDGDVRVPSTPHMVEEYVGKLVVQGQVYVGGAVATNGTGADEAPVSGTIDVRGSWGALKDAIGSMFDGKEQKLLYRLYLNDVDDAAGLWDD